MLIALAVLLSLAFIGWLIARAVRRKQIKAHLVMYWLSSLSGVFTLAYFLTMDIPRIAKILVCIVLGAALIFLAAYYQQRRQPARSRTRRR
jgi:drug/metabolite transporter (DMT)-like permease